MHGSKLLEVIAGLDRQELLRFHDFLQSPFFLQGRSNKPMVKLLDWILQVHPNLEDERLTKKATFRGVFPDRAFQKGKLEKMMSALFKELSRFVAYQSMLEEEGNISFQLRQARFFRERQMDKFYERIMSQIKKKQKKSASKDQEYYFDQYLIEKELSDFASLRNARKEVLNIPNTLASLDVFYLATKLEYSCWLLAQNQNLTAQHQADSLAFLEEILPSLEEKPLLKIPLIQAYTYAFQLLLGKQEGMFHQLNQLLQEKEKEIPLEQLKALQALCRNYCILKYNAGEGRHFLEEAFRLYRSHLEKGYLYYEGGLLPSTIKNLVGLALKLREDQWSYEFLQNVKDKIIGTKHPKDVYSFNLAWYFFSVEEYDKALELLTDSYEDLYYKVAAKRLEIKIRFEQDSPLTDSRLDAFKIYIFRVSKKSLSEIQRTANNNFVDLLKQIINPKTQVSPERIAKLIRKINNKKVVAEKEWLLEKLTTLTVF